MNLRDSEVICGLLKQSGYRICDSDEDADIVIFNTCSVRQHAEDRVWSLIGSYKGKKIIGLVGCMAQNYKEKAFERDSSVDFVVGPQDIHKLPRILESLGERSSFFERKVWEVDSSKRPEEIYHSGFYQDKEHAYVVISEGCSNFCSYCIVPFVRGALRHRKAGDILSEIRQALDTGITRVTLLGQNVNAYNDGGLDFTGLLKSVDALEGLEQFDFFTSHPKDVNEEFFRAIRDLGRLSKSLHLPVQSGSEKILKSMNRGYTLKEYLASIDSYRKIVKGGLLTTDIIVGFPGETAEDFRKTRDLLSRVKFNAAYIFKYSPRPNTEAAKITESLGSAEKEARHKDILDLQRGISNKLGKRKCAKKN